MVLSDSLVLSVLSTDELTSTHLLELRYPDIPAVLAEVDDDTVAAHSHIEFSKADIHRREARIMKMVHGLRLTGGAHRRGIERQFPDAPEALAIGDEVEMGSLGRPTGFVVPPPPVGELDPLCSLHKDPSPVRREEQPRATRTVHGHRVEADPATIR